MRLCMPGGRRVGNSGSGARTAVPVAAPLGLARTAPDVCAADLMLTASGVFYLLTETL